MKTPGEILNAGRAGAFINSMKRLVQALLSLSDSGKQLCSQASEACSCSHVRSILHEARFPSTFLDAQFGCQAPARLRGDIRSQ